MRPEDFTKDTLDLIQEETDLTSFAGPSRHTLTNMLNEYLANGGKITKVTIAPKAPLPDAGYAFNPWYRYAKKGTSK